MGTDSRVGGGGGSGSGGGWLWLMLIGGFLVLNVQSTVVSDVSSTSSSSSGAAAATTTTTSSENTCQCGVFLLGSPPLEFSADAKPVLSGNPVTANCSASDDKISCATICRQLIQAMSDSNENSPLVQTVVLAATRTLACQRYNVSHKVPLPRTILGPDHQTIAKLDESRKSWKFILGPASRRDTDAEMNESNPTIDSNNTQDEEVVNNPVGKLSEPKWLGGFYRWCDSHWVYAGVSLQEPLCCLKHLPKTCPSSRKDSEPEGRSASGSGSRSAIGGGDDSNSADASNRYGRQPRLIIKKRPEDDLSSEEDQDLQPLETSDGSSTTSSESSSKIPPTTASLSGSDSSAETEGPFGNASSEVIHVFDTMEDTSSNNRPNKRKPLNSTVLAEAFQFVGALMRSLGFGEVADGVAHVLPSSTASELLERVDVGGWVGTYQDKYLAWSREFNLGYCYVEYSLYNLASDGIMATTSNLIGRLFNTKQQPMSLQQQQQQSGPPPQMGLNGNGNNHMNNYISPMSSMADGFKAAFHGGHPGMPGNRRVRRSSNNVNMMSRSYSTIAGTKSRVSRQGSSSSNASNNRQRLEQLASIARVETAAPSLTSSTPLASPYEFVDVDRKYTQQQQQQPSHVTRISPNGQIQQQQQNNFDGQSQSRSKMPPPSSQHSVQPPRPRRQQQEKSHHNQQQQGKGKPSGKDASTGQLINLASVLMQSAMGGSEVDKVSMIMQNALPLVSQVATSPMIQGMVSNLVTSFLTPPRTPPPNKGQGGQGPTGPSGTSPSSSSSSNNNNLMSSSPARKPVREPVESNEINEMPVSSSNNRPTMGSGNGPSLNSLFNDLTGGDSSSTGPSGGGSGGGGGGGPGGLTSMLTQIVQTYVKHYLSTWDSKPPPKPNNQPVTSRPQKVTSSSSSSSSSGSSGSGSSSSSHHSDKDDKVTGGGDGGGGGGSDIVTMISDVAKPFFISYFGVVPDVPGFGQLSISERRDRPGSGKDSSVYITSDPDPGTGITDLVFGSPNLPDTGNAVFDFGNRIVYAFSRANDPMQGLYCFKQYSVNKMWDYFRVGVKTLFK